MNFNNEKHNPHVMQKTDLIVGIRLVFSCSTSLRRRRGEDLSVEVIKRIFMFKRHNYLVKKTKT